MPCDPIRACRPPGPPILVSVGQEDPAQCTRINADEWLARGCDRLRAQFTQAANNGAGEAVGGPAGRPEGLPARPACLPALRMPALVTTPPLTPSAHLPTPWVRPAEIDSYSVVCEPNACESPCVCPAFRRSLAQLKPPNCMRVLQATEPPPALENGLVRRRE